MSKFKELNREMPYYLAFGSNLSHRQMRKRCPDARPVAKLFIKQHALLFRGVADIVSDKKSKIPCGLYRVTRACERRLDVYEGVLAKVYAKKFFTFDDAEGKRKTCFYYQMCNKGIMPPTEEYLDRIAQGYVDFGLPIDKLADAVQYAWDNPKMTEAMRARLRASTIDKLATPEYLYQDKIEEVETDKFEPLEEEKK